MMLSRRQFLDQARSAALAGLGSWTTPLRSQEITLPKLLIVHCDGGWDPTLVFDPKVGIGSIAQEPGWELAQTAAGLAYVHHPNRPAVRSFFDNYGARAAIVNGLYTGAMDHRRAAVHTHAQPFPDNGRYCNWGAFYAAMAGPAMPLPFVSIDAPFVPGLYGNTSVSLAAEDLARIVDPERSPPSFGVGADGLLAEYVRANQVALWSGRSGPYLDTEKARNIVQSFERHPRLIEALRTTHAAVEPGEFDTPFDLRAKHAIQLMMQGFSQCVSLAFGDGKAWDTHLDNFTQQSAQFEALFTSLNSLMTTIDTLGQTQLITVVVVSELGRTPWLNAAGGKEHWPYTSLLAIGPGIRGGSVHGLTDDYLRGVPINPLFGPGITAETVPISHQHVFTALFLRYGIPYPILLPDVPPLATLLQPV